MYPKKTLIQISAVVLAVSAMPKFLSETFTTLPVLAQSPSPTAFPLPSTLPSGTEIKVDGSASMAVVNQALKQRFQQQYAGSAVNLATNGTDQALQSLLDGNLSLAAVGRSLTDAEKAKGLIEVPINRAKVAIIVSPENSFQGDITFEQFAKIFRGEITDWSELGGQAGAIRFVDHPDFSDTRRALSSYDVFQSAPFQTGANATQVASDDAATIVQALGKDGISYVIADQVLGQSNVKIIPMHETLPDDPRYPFSQPRGYVYKDSADAATQAFLGFATSPVGQEAIQTASTQGIAAGQAGAAAGQTGAAAGQAGASPDAAGVIVSPTAPAANPTESVTAASPTESETAVSSAPAATSETARGGLPAWLWLLGIPLIGGLLWWLLKGRNPAASGAASSGVAASGIAPASGVAAAPGVASVAAVPAAVPESRMILTPRDGRHTYAYWEAPEEQKARLREHGGQQLALRLHDVTGIRPDGELPPPVQQFNCNNSDQDRHFTVPETDRDYVGELGYQTAEGDWFKLARSNVIRIPSAIGSAANVAGVAGAALAGGAVIAGSARSIISDQRPPEVERPEITPVGRVVTEHVTKPVAEPVVEPIAEHIAGESIAEPVAAIPSAPAQPMGQKATSRCSIKNITVHSRHNCYLLSPEQMQQLQNQTAVTRSLQPGTHLIRIKDGAFGYGSTSENQEPIVLLWIHGGKVINKKTDIPVTATWSALNGYDETLTLEVLEPTTLHAFFFDTHLQDNDGEVTLSVVSLPNR